MSNYTTYPCSCIVCKLPKSSKGIHSHYLIAHTEYGKTQNRKNRLASGALGSKKAQQNAQLIQEKYSISPNKCKHCAASLPYKQRHNKYCSSSCAASANNANKKGTELSTSTKQKISEAVRLANRQKPIPPQYSKISFCSVCSVCIPHKHVKTCSSTCKSLLLSTLMTERIKQNRKSNYRRDKRSYLEESFETWLITNNISLKYEAEYTIRNHITQKWYFVDFYFPEVNLIVELDGRQHEKEKHKEADKLRDEYITTHLGISVYRISYDEYQSGIKIKNLLKLLVG